MDTQLLADWPYTEDSQELVEDPLGSLKEDFSRNALPHPKSFESSESIYIKPEVLTDDLHDEANGLIAAEGVDEFMDTSYRDDIPILGSDLCEFTAVKTEWKCVIKEELLMNESNAKSTGEYPLHIKETHRKSISPNECPRCGRHYHNKCNLRRHIRKMHPSDNVESILNIEGPDHYWCYLCEKRIAKEGSLSQHILNIHLDGRRGEVKCPPCGRRYCNMRYLMWHLRHKHSPNGEVRYMCFHCVNNFANKRLLKRHILNNHLTDYTKKILCHECDRPFSDMRNLKRHMNKKHTSNEPIDYWCYLCKKRITNECSFAEHILKIHMTSLRGKLLCPLCGRRCCDMSNLIWHLNHKHYPKSSVRYICYHCESSFTNKRLLLRHIINTHLRDCTKETLF